MSAIQATEPFLTWVLIKASRLVSHWWMGWSKFLSIKYVTLEPKEDLKVSSFFLGVVVVVQSLSSVEFSRSVMSDFATPWISARQASLSITNSWSLPKPMSIESVMPSSHLILCHPLPLLPPILPSIRVFSNESTLHMRWLKYWFQLQHQSFQWTPRTDL